MSDSTSPGYGSAADVPAEARGELGDLILSLADNKRLLGMRYSDWILGAPSLEAGIACSAMAQDEWGHSRTLYAMLRDFGQDPAYLEHDRAAEEYVSMELLDEPVDEWQELLALNLLVDTALSVVFESLQESSYEPIHYKVRKLLEEERFHFEHARGWLAMMATTPAGKEALRSSLGEGWNVCLRWFGPPDDSTFGELHGTGITSLDADGLRARWLEQVGPAVESAGLELAATAGGVWQSRSQPSFDGWNAARRRGPEGGGPDSGTLARVRGDLNRQLLMD
jgi:phenylacetate-CoA oxygenase PaaI subunit